MGTRIKEPPSSGALTGAHPDDGGLFQSRIRTILLRAGGRGRGGGLLEAVRAAEFLAEPLHAAGSVDELLLAREERVAGRADIDVDLRQHAARLERVAAGAVDVANLVFRVGLVFH